MASVSTDEQQPAEAERPTSVLSELTNAMVKLHKEQFGRGPLAARAAWAGDNTLVVTFSDALLPAEQALVEMGVSDRVQESRLYFQEATRERFIDTTVGIIGRDVAAFSSACDPRAQVVWEIFQFEPEAHPTH